MNELHFCKMSGSGNDFILIDNMNGALGRDAAELARILCPRKISVGADGLIMIEKSDKAEFRWRFHNLDGSEAEMCGNGARCAARFAVSRKVTGSNLRFETGAGIIRAEVKEGGKRVKVQLTAPFDLRRNIELSIDEKNHVLNFINTGVPHAVKIVPDNENVDVVGIGRKIRYHKIFQPKGTNANFTQIIDEHTLSVRTYERGVEDETLACGTGAAAAAIIASLNSKVRSPVTVHTRSGEELLIYFRIEHGKCRDVFLEGETTLVYEGKLELPAF